MTLCPTCRVLADEHYPDPKCSECGGEGLVGDPEKCTNDWPLCQSRWLNGSAKEDDWTYCSCDNGLPARLDRFDQARDVRHLSHLAKEVGERCWAQERLIYALLQEPGVASGLELALDLLNEMAKAMPPTNYRHRASTDHTAGVNHAVMHLRRRLGIAIDTAREEADLPPFAERKQPVTTDTSAPDLWEQLDMFGVSP